MGEGGRWTTRTRQIADLLGSAGDRLLRLAFQLCHRRSDAEDLVQQALEQLYRRWRKRGVDVDDAEAYARRVVVNEYLRRRRLGSASELITDVVPDIASVAPDAAVAERDAMWRSLDALPARQRAAVVLRYYEELPYRDIAAVLGCREATVRSLVARALHTLRATAVESPRRLKGTS
jgi:RNA polymerase sigma-70 factor (sigma-E family)